MLTTRRSLLPTLRRAATAPRHYKRGVSFAAMASSPSSTGKHAVSAAPWTAAVVSAQNKSRLLPQAIAHRGYKAAWPENTIEAMRGAVEAGAHAIETDVHLSSDGVVVLSHDPTLKRCYGKDDKISDCDWESLSKLKTLKAPHLSMPRLIDVLEWMNEPANHDIWVLLDIKIDDPEDALLAAIASALDSVPPRSAPWKNRIVLGCWNATFLKAARKHLPDHAIVHISFSLSYTSHFLEQPNVGANILQRLLPGPFGSSFMRRVAGPLLVWTVNSHKAMEWCLDANLTRRNGIIDGVITDDPKEYLAVCRRWENEQDGLVARAPALSIMQALRARLGDMFEFVRVQSSWTLFFLVRRFWAGKMDYLKKGEVL